MEDDMHTTLLAACSIGSISSSMNVFMKKRIRYHLSHYLAQGDTLFYQKNTWEGKCNLQVPKRSEVEGILKLFHSTHLAGNFGIKRTLYKIQEVYY